MGAPPTHTTHTHTHTQFQQQVKEDSFRTKSGRDVALRIYTQPQYIDQVRCVCACVCACVCVCVCVCVQGGKHKHNCKNKRNT